MSKFDRPVEIAATGYQAIHDPELCTNCETCLERCQMDAIESGDEHVTIISHRCIGCGLCVPTCPSEAITLKPRSDAPEPPADIMATMFQIMKERGLL